MRWATIHFVYSPAIRLRRLLSTTLCSTRTPMAVIPVLCCRVTWLIGKRFTKKKKNASTWRNPENVVVGWPIPTIALKSDDSETFSQEITAPIGIRVVQLVAPSCCDRSSRNRSTVPRQVQRLIWLNLSGQFRYAVTIGLDSSNAVTVKTRS